MDDRLISYYTIYMEILILSVIILIQTATIVFLVFTLKSLVSESMDKLSQKNAGVYYPKDAGKRKSYNEEDKLDRVPIEDVSDEDFVNAIAKGGPNA